jgi:hypothetical protein
LASLLVSLEKLAASVARLKGRISATPLRGGAGDAATITTAEEFAAAVRGGAN